MNMYTYRVEKYRPITLDEVVSHKDITSTSEYSLLRGEIVSKTDR